MNTQAFNKFDLSGRTAVVTGGGTGLGYFIARGLARSGARVLIAARRESVLKEAAEKLKAETGAEILYDTVDLNDRTSINSFIEKTLANLGGVDIFVGNAALQQMAPIEEISNDLIDAMLQVNVSANVEMIRAFAPHMRQQCWGRILLTSSTASVAASAHDNMCLYSTVKGAINSMARSSAVELGHYGITVNSLVLGPYVTENMAVYLAHIESTKGKEAAQAFTEQFSSMTALGRMGRPDEVEGLIQFIASDAASFITGTNLVADGGLTVMMRPNTPPDEPIYPANI